MARPIVDETGNTYGRLTVIGPAPALRAKHAYWLCRCECNTLVAVPGGQLRSGKTRSCGCLNLDNLKSRRTHGKTVGGYHRVYRIWRAMRNRCSKPSQINYERYGGRGIKVCDEWNASFEAFYRDMGDPPTLHHSIDRIDNEGPYEKANCKWSTPKEQAQHRRPNPLWKVNRPV